MSKGLSFESFGADANVGVSTLYEWLERHVEFAEAKKEADTKCQKWWESAGIMGMSGKINKFNAAVWIFNMKNRFKWRDVSVVKTESDDSKVTDDELIKSAKG